MLKSTLDLAKIKAKELETRLVQVSPSAPLSEVVSVLRQKNAYEVFILKDSKIGMVNIRDILRARNIRSRRALSLAIQTPRLHRDASIAEAARLMTELRVRALPTTDGHKVTGEVTEHSICKALSSAGETDFPIGKIMTPHPVTLNVGDRLGKAKTIINRRNIDHLPVLESDRIVGVITSHRILDTMIPAERPRRHSRVPEARRMSLLTVRGLMERPFICSVDEGAFSVLGKMIQGEKTYALVGFGEELQGIVTYRDFVKLLTRPRRVGIPIYMVGLPDNIFEAEAARVKFSRAINLLRKSFPDILEARSTIKTTTPGGEKGRKRYEIKASVYTPRRVFVYSESGWDLASTFDVISDRFRRILARKAGPRGRKRRSGR